MKFSPDKLTNLIVYDNLGNLYNVKPTENASGLKRDSQDKKAHPDLLLRGYRSDYYLVTALY